MYIIIDVIKVDDKVVITIHHQHRWNVHIAGQAHLERVDVVVKDVRSGVHPGLSQCRHCHEAATHE
jgi:hypothetical protein